MGKLWGTQLNFTLYPKSLQYCEIWFQLRKAERERSEQCSPAWKNPNLVAHAAPGLLYLWEMYI